tara:strand:- start:20644 stop:21273 length:630 start_codon:yes stop_codon:yes gene_type:complete
MVKKRNNEIRGQKLYLRTPRLKDYKNWSNLRKESMEFLVPWEPAWQSQQHTLISYFRLLSVYKKRLRNQEQYSFFIFNNHQKLVGGVNVFNIRYGISQSCTLGYWIGLPYANKGYMTEALSLLIEFLFNNLKINRIEAACLPHNSPSKKLLLKLNFVEEGYAKDYLKINGKWEDHILFALNYKEYYNKLIFHKTVKVYKASSINTKNDS